MLDAEVLVKPENLQKTGSFKIRGAYNRVASLTGEERSRGVIAASVYWFAFLGGREKMVRLPRSEKPIEGPETPMPPEPEA